ncbi:hypothetical protein Tco_1533799 [Tanacetum coccineum]
MLRVCVLDFRGSWDVHLPLEVSFLILWAEVGEGQLIGLELVQETTEKISQIKDRLKAARVVRFGKKGKLAPRECLGLINTKVPLDEIQVDAKLNFVEEPVEILEREFKKLKRSRIDIVKVRWNSKRCVLILHLVYRVDDGDFMEFCVDFGVLL